jgi:hypothetical protein
MRARLAAHVQLALPYQLGDETVVLALAHTVDARVTPRVVVEM